MPLITERNKDIYEAHKNGMSYAKIGKEYNISAQRVAQICHDVERGRNRPDSLFSFLEEHYPDVTINTRSGAVFAVYDYVYKNDYRNRPEYTLDNLLKAFETIPRLEYPYVRKMGVKKLAFMQRLVSDRKAGKI